jgi:Icc-related predicted phosphoesterase
MKQVINFKAQKEEWEKAKDKAFNKLNAKSKIDGFRPGKAPRNVFEKNYPGQIVMEAADILISHDSPKFLHSDQDFAHSGLQGITRYCEKHNVPLNIHGHHHDQTECLLDNGTRTICCYKTQIVSISPSACIIEN